MNQENYNKLSHSQIEESPYTLDTQQGKRGGTTLYKVVSPLGERNIGKSYVEANASTPLRVFLKLFWSTLNIIKFLLLNVWAKIDISLYLTKHEEAINFVLLLKHYNNYVAKVI